MEKNFEKRPPRIDVEKVSSTEDAEKKLSNSPKHKFRKENNVLNPLEIKNFNLDPMLDGVPDEKLLARFEQLRQEIRTKSKFKKLVKWNERKEYESLKTVLDKRGIFPKNEIAEDTFSTAEIVSKDARLSAMADRLSGAVYDQYEKEAGGKVIETLTEHFPELGHENPIFRKLEDDARELFGIMRSYKKDTPEFKRAKLDWKKARSKVVAYEGFKKEQNISNKKVFDPEYILDGNSEEQRGETAA